MIRYLKLLANSSLVLFLVLWVLDVLSIDINTTVDWTSIRSLLVICYFILSYYASRKEVKQLKAEIKQLKTQSNL